MRAQLGLKDSNAYINSVRNTNILVGCARITTNSFLCVEIIFFKLMPGQGSYGNAAKGTFFGINQLVVVAVDPKDGDKDGDSPGNEGDGEEDPGELGSDSIQFNSIQF